jgi:RNA polymerase sigma factor (TIGR02999 family)
MASEPHVLGTNVSDGPDRSTESLFAVVYAELRRLAAIKLAREAAHSLQPTELVNEAYLRLIGKDGGGAWTSRRHFFGAAAEAMRRILVERARRRKAAKRGGNEPHFELPDVADEDSPNPLDLLAVDEALKKLEQSSPRHAELIKLRFFAGLTIADAAEALGVSSTTADTDWVYAKTWLRVELEGQSGGRTSETV